MSRSSLGKGRSENDLDSASRHGNPVSGCWSPPGDICLRHPMANFPFLFSVVNWGKQTKNSYIKLWFPLRCCWGQGRPGLSRRTRWRPHGRPAGAASDVRPAASRARAPHLKDNQRQIASSNPSFILINTMLCYTYFKKTFKRNGIICCWNYQQRPLREMEMFGTFQVVLSRVFHQVAVIS